MDLSDPQRLLAQARAGNRASLGALLDRYRTHLRLRACSRIGLQLQARANASDVVQESFLLASRHFHRFRGTSEKELVCWLERILRRCLIRLMRRHLCARKRDACRERSLERPASNSKLDLASQIIGHGTSPSAGAQRRELADLVVERLARLRPAHRDVLVLRNLKGLPFDEVARRMHRSPGAVRVLWLRALDQLRQQRLSEDWL